MKKFMALTLALIMSLTCFSLVSFAEDTNTVEHLTEVPEGYVGIYTKDDLYAVRENPSGKYILMNDIVFEDADYVKGGDFYNSGTGWEPIGTSSTPFKGVFDGNGYIIYNLYINASNEGYQGLFGDITSAVIENVNLKDAVIIGKDCVGGIVGAVHATSTISNCGFLGSVTGCDRVGGICGSVWDSSVNIVMCDASGTISATNYAGGICGSFYSSSSVYDFCIESCFNSAKIFAKSRAGGILGEGDVYLLQKRTLESVVSKCINVGDIICTGDYIGGIIGISIGDYYNTTNSYNHYISVENCYNIGCIVGDKYVGGLIGNPSQYSKSLYSYSIGNINANTCFGGCFGSSPSIVTFCYYLDDAVTNPTCTAGTMKSIDQLKRKGNYEQWNFDTVWTMEGREDYIYPELRDIPLVFPEDFNHKHEYTTEITTPATHVATGVMTYTCECGDTYTEDIDKIADHSYNAVVTDPTCIAKGYTTYTCECNDSYIADYVDAKGHDFKSTVTESDCIEFGYTTFACECGENYTCDYTNAKGHTYISEITTPATHTTDGVKTFTCKCGDSYIDSIAKTDVHTYSATVTNATCTADGYTTYTCECGDTYKEIINSTGHNYDGSKCINCGDDKAAECNCNCHKSGISAIIWKIINIFNKLLKKKPVCSCGVNHY